MEDVFVLPERWKILDRKEVSKWASKTFGCLGGVDNGSFLCVEMKFYPQKSCYHFYDYDDNGHSSYTEISFDQFKQYVLGEKQQQKEIVGYNVKESFSSIAFKLLPSIYKGWGRELGFDIDLIKKDNINIYKQAGVLDLWFTPVYASETPQITINGYKGEFFDDYVKFGCAEFNKDLFTILYRQSTHPLEHTNRTIESVTIGKGTFIKEQIKEIAEFYLNKKNND